MELYKVEKKIKDIESKIKEGSMSKSKGDAIIKSIKNKLNSKIIEK